MKKNQSRIDYKVLSTTGERVEVQPSTQQPSTHQPSLQPSTVQSIDSHQTINEMSEETRLKQLIIQQSTFQDEILDTIEDNSPAFIDKSPDLMQTCITKIEKLRIQYRSINNEIKAEMPTDRYEDSFQKFHNNCQG